MIGRCDMVASTPKRDCEISSILDVMDFSEAFGSRYVRNVFFAFNVNSSEDREENGMY
jgi:hypothetical protein